MGERTGIEWADMTFNPWWGCTEIGPGCDNCYARAWAHRLGRPWGLEAPRREFGDAHWNEPRRWAARLPRKLGRRPRVFCASMADILDKHAPPGARDRLWQLILDTSEHLDWLLLTKRIGNAEHMIPPEIRALPSVWLGATVVNQEEVDRDIPKLVQLCTKGPRWLSIEPMLGPIEFSNVTRRADCVAQLGKPALSGIDWVIVGGESGPGSRPFAIRAAVELVEQCHAVDVPVFVKQLGALPVDRDGERVSYITHKKGADMAEWPAQLQVRQFPRNAA